MYFEICLKGRMHHHVIMLQKNIIASKMYFVGPKVRKFTRCSAHIYFICSLHVVGCGGTVAAALRWLRQGGDNSSFNSSSSSYRFVMYFCALKKLCLSCVLNFISFHLLTVVWAITNWDFCDHGMSWNFKIMESYF